MLLNVTLYNDHEMFTDWVRDPLAYLWTLSVVTTITAMLPYTFPYFKYEENKTSLFSSTCITFVSCKLKFM